MVLFFFSSRRRHTRFDCDWSSDVCSSDLVLEARQTAHVGMDPEPLFHLVHGCLDTWIVGSEGAEVYESEEARVHGHIEGVAIGPGRRHPREALFTFVPQDGSQPVAHTRRTCEIGRAHV